jgi:hypothetical protein
LALSLLCSAAVLFAFTAWTRVRLGLSQATVSRYVYVATALTVPAVVWGIDRVARWARARNGGNLAPYATAVVLVLALTLVTMIGAARAEFRGRSKVLHSAETRILAGAALVRQHVVVLNPYPDPIHSHPLTTDILAKPSVQSQLPKAQPSAAAILEARGRIQVVVQQAPVTSVPTAPTARVGSTVIGGSAATCSTETVASGTLVLIDTLDAGARAIFTAPGNRLITSLLVGAGHSPPQSWAVTKGVPVYVATSYGGGRLQVKVIGSGALTVCLE